MFTLSIHFSMLWEALKLFLMILASLFNLPLFFKILTRPSIQNIFNVSLACLFGFLGISGPFLVYLYFEILHNWILGSEGPDMAERRFDCARFIEVRNMYIVAEQVIGQNIMFRFFLIKHSDKGLVSSGVYRSRFVHCCFLTFTISFFLYTFLPWMTASAIVKDYPENTVKGRICLGLRIDWDKDQTKETSDIYIKPRLIVFAFTCLSAFWFLYISHLWIQGKNFASVRKHLEVLVSNVGETF